MTIIKTMKSHWIVGVGILLLVIGVARLVSSFPTLEASIQDLFGQDQSAQVSELGFVPFAVLDEGATGSGLPTLAALLPETIDQQTPTVVETQEFKFTPQPTPTPFPPVEPQRLIIPIIELDAPIIPAEKEQVKVEGKVLEQWLAPNKFAAGWHQSSARLGEIGNTVLNGHHNVDGEVFGNLEKLAPGDLIYVTGGTYRYTFVVNNVMILPEKHANLETRLENARWIQRSDDERLTLVTCWPKESNTHRLIVVAQPTGEVVDLGEGIY